MAWKNFNAAACIGERRLINWRGTVLSATTMQIIITPFTELSSICVGSRKYTLLYYRGITVG